MKILCYRNTYEYNFEAMIGILSKTKHKVGYLHGQIEDKTVKDFNPDIILHNIDNVESFPIKTNAISININETLSDRSFTLKNQLSANYIKPFILLKDTDIKESEINKFTSDVVYIGSPFIFHRDIVSFLTNQDMIVKFFDHNALNCAGYCGVCEPKDYFRFYKSSKASIVNMGDTKRIMDIVTAEGNPVLIDSDVNESIERIKEAVNNGKRYTIPNYSKEEVVEKHTVFDRVSEIFLKVGLSQISKEVKALKTEWKKKV